MLIIKPSWLWCCKAKANFFIQNMLQHHHLCILSTKRRQKFLLNETKQNKLYQCLERYSLNFLLSSVQFSHSVVSNSLRPHEVQLARPPCRSLTPGIHSDSHPSSQWCHPAMSSSDVPFSSCPQSLPESESFPMS